MSRSQSKHVRVDPTNPEGAGQCDLCGRWYQLRTLQWNYAWAGTHLYNTQSLRCRECIDVPNEQLRTIILPPDPPPLINSRVPDFAFEERTVMMLQFSSPLVPPAQYPYASGPFVAIATQDGEEALTLQYLTSV